MKPRTIGILLLMTCILLITSAFGAYKDGPSHEKGSNKPKKATVISSRESSKEIVGASGAGTSYKQSQTHLDISEKADGPHVKDGPNPYRGKGGGYDLRDMYDSDDETDNDSDDSDDDNNQNQSEFKRKIKYVKKMFEEIFSKWKMQESVMAPTSIEEQLDNPMDQEGFKIREKFKKGARQGMRKLKNAFRGRFRSGD
jgi:hypothetical protein